MLKAIIVIVIVVGALIAGLLTLKRSGAAGMPSEEVVRRAQERQRGLDAEDKRESDQDS